MPKIKLHTIQMQDASYLDLIYDQVDIIYHDNIINIFDYTSVLLNRHHCQLNLKLCIDYLTKSVKNRIILLDLLEGTNTTIYFLTENNLLEYFTKTNQILIISSGDFSNNTTFANIDSFLDITASSYNITISLNQFENIYIKKNKSYNYLCLNKNSRPHRQALIAKLQERNLLDSALWSDLSANIKISSLVDDFYNDQLSNISINATEHNMSQPAVIINPALYTETYFNVVTETNFEIPHTLCSEKIYKPILMGHPFIAVSNYKFYQHLKDRGYKTFDALIDESFDNIENNEDRLTSIVNSIDKLCQQDLDDFLAKAKPICEHNRLNYFRELGCHSLIRYNKLTTFFKEYAKTN
jgi:hypothetical protein